MTEAKTVRQLGDGSDTASSVAVEHIVQALHLRLGVSAGEGVGARSSRQHSTPRVPPVPVPPRPNHSQALIPYGMTECRHAHRNHSSRGCFLPSQAVLRYHRAISASRISGFLNTNWMLKLGPSQ